MRTCPQASISFVLSEQEKKAVNRALEQERLEFDADGLFDFMKQAVKGREYAKLVFTRNLSDALELIAEWGIQIGLTRKELSFLTIGQILESLTHTFHSPLKTHFKRLSSRARERNIIGQALHLPYLISDPSDLFIIPALKSSPNFITTKRREAPLCYLTGRESDFVQAKGQIVLIERADPGYDWLFLNSFAGLITKYGGSNSHMAIR